MFRKGAPGHFSLCQVFSWSATCWRDIKLLLTRTWRNSDFLIALFNFFFPGASCCLFWALKSQDCNLEVWEFQSWGREGWEGSRLDSLAGEGLGEALLILLGLGSFGFHPFNIFKVIF